MPYRYLPEVAIADIAFEARGATLEELFSASVDAVLGAMVQAPESIGADILRVYEAVEKDADLLLLGFLQEVVFFKDAERLLLRCPSPRIYNGQNGLELHAELEGERIDPGRHELLTDVKGVTLHLLTVERLGEGWLSRVVLDV